MLTSTYNINDDRIKEVLRVKENLGTTLDRPLKQPTGKFKTVYPNEKLDLQDWFAYIKKTLRTKDEFGNLDIK